MRFPIMIRPLSVSTMLVCSVAASAQLDDGQVDFLADLNCELSNAWSINDLQPGTFPIGGESTSCCMANLYTAKTYHDRGNEGVSLYFFEKSLADSVKGYFLPADESTNEFIRTTSFIGVVAYLSSNGKLYDMYTREMLKELRSYFINWDSRY